MLCLLCAFQRGSRQAGSAAIIAQNPKRMPLSRSVPQEKRLTPTALPASGPNPSGRHADSDAASIRMRWIFESDGRLPRLSAARQVNDNACGRADEQQEARRRLNEEAGQPLVYGPTVAGEIHSTAYDPTTPSTGATTSLK